jgi:hypothetical protein
MAMVFLGVGMNGFTDSGARYTRGLRAVLLLSAIWLFLAATMQNDANRLGVTRHHTACTFVTHAP